jgi:hypothetical protein
MPFVAHRLLRRPHDDRIIEAVERSVDQVVALDFLGNLVQPADQLRIDLPENPADRDFRLVAHGQARPGPPDPEIDLRDAEAVTAGV